MIRVTKESSAPPGRLWSVMSDVRRWADWLPTVDAVTPLDPDRLDEVGASYTVEQPGLPTAVWTVTEPYVTREAEALDATARSDAGA
jgi:hypothetical protein